MDLFQTVVFTSKRSSSNVAYIGCVFVACLVFICWDYFLYCMEILTDKKSVSFWLRGIKGICHETIIFLWVPKYKWVLFAWLLTIFLLTNLKNCFCLLLWNHLLILYKYPPQRLWSRDFDPKNFIFQLTCCAMKPRRSDEKHAPICTLSRCWSIIFIPVKYSSDYILESSLWLFNPHKNGLFEARCRMA
jgi:hypothetical protein